MSFLMKGFPCPADDMEQPYASRLEPYSTKTKDQDKAF